MRNLFAACLISLGLFGCHHPKTKTPDTTPTVTIPPVTKTGVDIHTLRDETVVLVLKHPNGRYEMYCSGIWIKDNQILTANHCVEAAVRFGLEEEDEDKPVDTINKVISYKTYSDYLRDNEMVSTTRARVSTVSRVEGATDLALLTVAGNAPSHGIATLRSLPINDGSDVWVVGHSAGMQFSLSKGIISASRKDNDLTLLQLSVAAFGGNSGGPVFDTDGHLVGVISFGHRFAALMTFATHRDSIVDFLAQ